MIGQSIEGTKCSVAHSRKSSKELPLDRFPVGELHESNGILLFISTIFQPHVLHRVV